MSRYIEYDVKSNDNIDISSKDRYGTEVIIDTKADKAVIKEDNMESMDDKLYHLFEYEDVPEHINIALKNRIYYEAVYGKKRIELWWLPAVINTVIAVMGIIFAVVLYEMAKIGGSYTIIPNIIDKISELGLKLILMWACGDMFLGWLATAIVIPIASGKHIKGSI